jgi:tetratricopeptide (TPR) repeat protein
MVNGEWAMVLPAYLWLMDRIEKIREFLLASPGDNFLRHALALEYIKSGDEVQARELFEAILTDSPGYVGSYYHLAKLLEKMDQPALAIEWYEKGMEVAKKAGDGHAYNELRAAYEELAF